MDLLGKIREYRSMLLALPPLALFIGVISFEINTSNFQRNDETSYLYNTIQTELKHNKREVNEIDETIGGLENSLLEMEASIIAIDSANEYEIKTRTEYSFGPDEEIERVEILELVTNKYSISRRKGENFISVWMENENRAEYFYDIGKDRLCDVLIMTPGKTHTPIQRLDYFGTNEITPLEEIEENKYMMQFESFRKDSFINRIVYRKDEAGNIYYSNPLKNSFYNDKEINMQGFFFQALSLTDMINRLQGTK